MDSDWGKVAVSLVVLGFIGVFLFAKCGADVSGHTRITAQTEANAWVRSMGLDAKATCADRDTDGDGYVSCTLVVTEADGRKHIEPLECAGALTINNGCRAPKAVIQR